MGAGEFLTCLALPLCAAMPAAAQSPRPAEQQNIAQQVISATRVSQDGFNLPMAIDRIDANTISEAKPQVNLSEALTRVPGIVALNRQNYAQDLQISSRGFGARSTFGVRGVRLIADGIPATMPDGQGQAATFNLSSAERIEVLRGPFASLYGNSSGGVVQIFTADGPATPTLTTSFLAGSFGTKKIATQFGAQYGTQLGAQHELVNTIVDVSRFETDGYRAHSAATRDQLNAKLSFNVAGGKLTLIANGLDQPDTQDPLGLTRAQALADPRQVDVSAIAFNTRKSIRQHQLGAVYDMGNANEMTGSWQARIYGGARTVKQFLGQDGNTPLGAGGVVDLDRTYAGIGVRWTRRVSIDERALIFSLGIDTDKLDERRRGFVNNAGVQGVVKRDEDDRVANTDFYAQAEWPLSEFFSISFGARASRVKFDSRDHYIAGVNPDDSGRVDFSRTTPALGAIFKLAPRWNIYANVGEGFETPTFAELAYRPGGATGLNFALRPALSRHAEIGFKGRPGDRTRFNAALFQINTRDEIVTNASAGGRSDFRNASRTKREGVEMSLESMLPFGFEAAAAYTWLNARFTDSYRAGTPPVAVPAGNLLPGVARVVFYGELIWRHALSGFHAGIEYRASSKVTVNEANVDAAAGYGVANARGGFQQVWITDTRTNLRISEFVRIDNVTDHRYIGSVIVAEARGRFFEPAPGRTVMVGVNVAVAF